MFCTVPVTPFWGADGPCAAAEPEPEPAPALSPAWLEADFAPWPVLAVLRPFAAFLALARAFAALLPVRAELGEESRPWTRDELSGRVAGSLAATALTTS